MTRLVVSSVREPPTAPSPPLRVPCKAFARSCWRTPPPGHISPAPLSNGIALYLQLLYPFPVSVVVHAKSCLGIRAFRPNARRNCSPQRLMSPPTTAYPVSCTSEDPACPVPTRSPDVNCPSGCRRHWKIKPLTYGVHRRFTEMIANKHHESGLWTEPGRGTL